MPVTSFALIIVSVLCAAALTVLAMSTWGVTTVLPGLVIVALLARWGLAQVPYDDSHP